MLQSTFKACPIVVGRYSKKSLANEVWTEPRIHQPQMFTGHEDYQHRGDNWVEFLERYSIRLDSGVGFGLLQGWIDLGIAAKWSIDKINCTGISIVDY